MKVTEITPNAPVCPPNPGAHNACAKSAILQLLYPNVTSTPSPTPSRCNLSILEASNRTCEEFPAPCIMVPLPTDAKVGFVPSRCASLILKLSILQICCTWKDWASCDAANTTTPCETGAVVHHQTCVSMIIFQYDNDVFITYMCVFVQCHVLRIYRALLDQLHGVRKSGITYMHADGALAFVKKLRDAIPVIACAIQCVVCVNKYGVAHVIMSFFGSYNLLYAALSHSGVFSLHRLLKS